MKTGSYDTNSKKPNKSIVINFLKFQQIDYTEDKSYLRMDSKIEYLYSNRGYKEVRNHRNSKYLPHRTAEGVKQ